MYKIWAKKSLKKKMYIMHWLKNVATKFLTFVQFLLGLSG